MTCERCGNPAHIDFNDGTTRCNPCHGTTTWGCRCQPVKAERLPEWVRLAKAQRLPVKELVA